MSYLIQRDGLFCLYCTDLAQEGEEESSDQPDFSTDEWMEWLEEDPRNESLWDRGEAAAEYLAQSLGFPRWLTSLHTVFRSREQPVVVEVGTLPGWKRPIRLPASVDGFPVEAVVRERAVVYEDTEDLEGQENPEDREDLED